MDVSKAINLFKRTIIGSEQGHQEMVVDTSIFPLWISTAVEIFCLKLENQNAYLIYPVQNFEFDQLVNLVRQVEKKTGGVAVLIADDIAAKFRPLFVKHSIPFVYIDKSIFAPKLGVKLINLKKVKRASSRSIATSITPFELKLISGFLTGFITSGSFNLKDLENILINNNYKCSKMKISNAINNLIALEFLSVTGRGPNRVVQFYDKQTTWNKLKTSQLNPFYKIIENRYLDISGNYILSGETALAHFSMLGDPKVKCIGLTNKEFKQIDKTSLRGDEGTKPQYLLNVFKEVPSLFSIKGALNLIEVYFTMHTDQDERVQICLEEMLEEIGIKG
jgi:hypothetical protein